MIRQTMETALTKTRHTLRRCSTDKQDLSAQRVAPVDLDVANNWIYTNHGLAGTNRERPGLAQALAATREGDTFVAPRLDRLARFSPYKLQARHRRQAGETRCGAGISWFED
jgi:DNA invertase Pin-like site-specific DNA recombinase